MTISLIPPNNGPKYSKLEELNNIDSETVPLANLSALVYYSTFQKWQTRKLPTTSIDSTGNLTVANLTVQPGTVTLYEDYSTDRGTLKFERTGRKLQFNKNDGSGYVDIVS